MWEKYCRVDNAHALAIVIAIIFGDMNGDASSVCGIVNLLVGTDLDGVFL